MSSIFYETFNILFYTRKKIKIEFFLYKNSYI